MDGRRQVSDSPRDASTRAARRESRGGIRLTLRGRGHTVGAHWSEPRARATFPRSSIEDRTTYSRTLPEVCDLSDEERPSKVLRRAACQRVQED